MHSDEQPRWPDPTPPPRWCNTAPLHTNHTHCWHQSPSLSSSTLGPYPSTSTQKPLELPAADTPTTVKQRAKRTEGGQKSDLNRTRISCGDQAQLSQTSC